MSKTQYNLKVTKQNKKGKKKSEFYVKYFGLQYPKECQKNCQIVTFIHCL